MTDGKPLKTRDRILTLLAEDGRQSASSLSEKLGITSKAVEKQLAKLKVEGLISREGPARGGSWVVKS